jgi:hypothetical protein
MNAAAPYRAALTGALDSNQSRWLWLVKWLLLIPHLIVLIGLWIAAWLMTIVAGFAILFTGRYPRGLFNFNLGVMRWSWRVSFYSIGAFGTDRYPPFSLRSDDRYPADFVVEYPEHLSRGLVLVKWWLLAIPQYVIVSFLVGGWGFGWLDGGHVGSGGGLIAVLAIVAAVVRMFTGKYPLPLFDLMLGLNRWCFRVLAYSALMRDEYPPLRLDMGGSDPAQSPGLATAA